MPVDVRSERVDGPTPSGGDYSIAHFFNGEREPCGKDEATGVEILEYDKDGANVARTWLERPKGKPSEE